MSNYTRNKKAAITYNNSPTLTDQSQANSTDINVIVGQFNISGRVPGAAGEPMTGDFTQYPRDLREMIDMGRSLEAKRRQLPKELRDKPMEELLALTPEQLKTILTPPQPKAEPKEIKEIKEIK